MLLDGPELVEVERELELETRFAIELGLEFEVAVVE